MRPLSYLVTAVLALVVIVVAGAFLLPREVRVERSLVLPRPACTVYALVDGFAREKEWSPWAALDPAMSWERSGPPRGVGAKLAWSSSIEEVGAGTQEMTLSEPCHTAERRVEFGDMGPSTARFDLSDADGGTNVTWSMTKDVGFNPIGRLMGVLFDGWIGPDFERGLAKMRAVAETLPEADFAGVQIAEVEVEPVPLATLLGAAPKDPVAVQVALGAGYAQIEAAVLPRGLTIAGPRRATFRDDEDGWSIVLAEPVRGPGADLPPGPVRVAAGYSGPALRAESVGTEDVAGAWAKLKAWAEAYGVRPGGTAGWVEYEADPVVDGPEHPFALVLPLR